VICRRQRQNLSSIFSGGVLPLKITFRRYLMRALITLLLFSFSLLFSDNYYVETTGTDNASCSVSNPCEHIQTAINLTSNGDMVIVSGGTYLENLLIETGITLKSADQNNPAIIDGSSPETDPALWNGGSCIVIRTPRGASSRVTATVEDVHLTGGKGTVIIEDTNHDGDFDDPEDEIKIVGGGMIIHNAGLLSRGNKIMNNGDSSTKEGGAVYAAGTGADIPDDNPADPPEDHFPNERSVIVFEGTTFSGNDAQIGHTVMVNGWGSENRFIDIDFGNSHFDCVFDSDNNELDGVSEYWVKGKDNTSFDFTGGITGEVDAIITDVWVDPNIGVNEGNIIGDINNPFFTIDYAMSMIYQTEDNPITIHLTAGEFSPTNTDETFPIIMQSHLNLIGAGEEVTILDAQQTDRVITMESCQNNIISNLTISGGNAPIADWENYSRGGGIYLFHSDPILTHVTISGNEGGGLYLSASNPTLTHVTISWNDGFKSGGMGLYYSNPILTNVLISGNTANSVIAAGGMYLLESNPTLNHVTISGNTSESGSGAGGGFVLWNSAPTLINSIIWGNGSQWLYLVHDSLPNITYSDIEDGWEGAGNLDVDPLFTDPENGDFTLLNSSQCIDAGDPNLWYNDINGTRSDMGVTGGLFIQPNFISYNFGEVGELESTAYFTLYNYRETLITIDYVSFLYNTYSTYTTFPITINPLETGVIIIDCLPTTLGLIEDSMVLNSPDLPEGISVHLSVTGSEGNILSGTLSGELPSAVYRITGDINVVSGDELILLAGTEFLFDGQYNFNIAGDIKAQGTELDSIIFDNYGNENWRGFTLAYVTEETVFNYVRISGAVKEDGGGMKLFESNPILTNVIITDNATSNGDGGGMYLENSDPTLINVIISDNLAFWGAGVGYI